MSTKKAVPPKKLAPSPPKKKKEKQVVLYDYQATDMTDNEWLQQLGKAVDCGLRGELTTPDYTQHTKVGDIGIEVVAGIAAHLPTNLDAPNAIRRAYQLLTFASAGRRGEVSLSGYEEGIQRLLNTQAAIAEMVGEKKKLLSNLFQKLPSDAVTAPLDKVLSNLLPNHTDEHKLMKFMRWMEIYIPWMRGDEQNLALCEADSLIAKWRIEGVPKDVYLKAREEIAIFLRYEKHCKDSENGKAGQAAKKAKQEQVKKKTDGRNKSKHHGIVGKGRLEVFEE